MSKNVDIDINKDCDVPSHATVIKHLVMSGGGPAGLITYGAAKHLHKKGFWKLENIESIYGCSIGACIGIILSLNYEWEWLDDYFIKRPWTKLIHTHTNSLIQSFYEKGFLGEKMVHDIMSPLFKAKDLNPNITFKQLYEWNKKEIHIYTTNINTFHFEKIDMSYKTHPDLSVVKALCMTTAYPIAFKPICDGDACYIDGGLLNNYPLNDCITQTKCNKDEILAFKNIWITNDTVINEESTMFDFMNMIIKKMQREIDTESKQTEVKHTVRCIIDNMQSFTEWGNAISTEESRAAIVEKGLYHADLFLAYINTF
jgi:predicted acylesterase/phospholipase RssA